MNFKNHRSSGLEVTCAFSLPQQALQDELELLSVALEIGPTGSVWALFLVPPRRENSLIPFVVDPGDTDR